MSINVEKRSLVFSEVGLYGGGKSADFLAPGIPDKHDIDGLDQFSEFVEELEDATDIDVSVRSFIFGNGESEHADESELEYIDSHRKEIEDKYGIDWIQSDNFSILYEPE